MSAGIHHISIEQGATFTQVMTWKISDAAVNLTGYTARLKARSTVGSRTIPTMSLTSAVGGNITLGGVAGTITISLSATETTALNPGKYTYDLELQSSGGVVTRLLKGNLTVVAEVTY
jgi:hypothetical protein